MSTIWRVLRVVSRCVKRKKKRDNSIRISKCIYVVNLAKKKKKIQCQLFLFYCAYHDFGTAVFANNSHFPHQASSSTNKSTFLLNQFLIFLFCFLARFKYTIWCVLIVYYTHLYTKKKIECGSKDSRKTARINNDVETKIRWIV